MAIRRIYYSLDKYFHQTTGRKIILNDFPVADIDVLKDMLMTVYEGTEIDTIPKCSCERTAGGYKEGFTCEYCGTKVESIFKNKDPDIWLRAIDGCEKFINPIFWKMLSRTVSNKVDVLRWIGDSSYNPQTLSKIDTIINAIHDLPGFERRYSWLYKNMSNIIITISSIPKMRTGDKQEIFKDLLETWKTYKHITSDYMPILNKRMFVMEKTNKGQFTNLSSSNSLYDLAITFVYKSKQDSLVQKERAMTRTVAVAADNAYMNTDEYLSGKPKIMRKHMYGTRSPFTARAVITPIVGPHRYDDIEIPWGIGVTLFRPHILNLLKKRGLGYMESSNLLMAVVNKYNPMIHECLNELISMAPGDRGPVVIFQRNPSMLQGSALRLSISKFKDDPNNTTISVSLLNAKLPNYDIDGDEMNLTLAIDNLIADELLTFAPHHSLMVTDSPSEVSGLSNLTGPVTASISNALANERERLTNKE